MYWSKLIKNIRNTLMLSQNELADLLGVSFASVNRWENEHNEPTVKIKRKIKKICDENNIAFEISCEEIADGGVINEK